MAGTDGGDSEYRMNIEARYGKLPPLKRRLSAVHIVQWVYFGLLLLELLYNQTTGRLARLLPHHSSLPTAPSKPLPSPHASPQPDAWASFCMAFASLAS